MKRRSSDQPQRGSRARARKAAVSLSESSVSDLAQRLLWVQRIVPVAFMLGSLLSARLWLSARSYPLTPVVDFLSAIPPPVDAVVFSAFLLSLAGIALVPTSRSCYLAFLVLILILGCADQSRWQPWVYQYTAILVASACYYWTPGGVPEQQSLLQIWRVIVVTTYIWSGLQKANGLFVFHEAPAIAGPLLRVFPEGQILFSYGVGALAPLLETAVGIGLITPRYRALAVIGALSMHVMILMSLVARNHNSVVWPWNITMMTLTLVLFWRTSGVTASSIIRMPRGIVYKALAVLFVVMPVLSFSYLDMWDAYLSAALYSGNTIAARVYVSETTERQLPEGIQRYVEHSSPRGVLPSYVDLDRWSFRELNVPFYPEPRIYWRVARQICGYAANPDRMWLAATEKPSWPRGEQIRRLCSCRELARARDIKDCRTY